MPLCAVDVSSVPDFSIFLLLPFGLSFTTKDLDAVLASLLRRETEFNFEGGFNRLPFWAEFRAELLGLDFLKLGLRPIFIETSEVSRFKVIPC